MWGGSDGEERRGKGVLREKNSMGKTSGKLYSCVPGGAIQIDALSIVP